jgi:hypothetical protein
MKEKLFRQIAEENYCRIFRICYRYLENREEASDACQFSDSGQAEKTGSGSRETCLTR